MFTDATHVLERRHVDVVTTFLTNGVTKFRIKSTQKKQINKKKFHVICVCDALHEFMLARGFVQHSY